MIIEELHREIDKNWTRHLSETRSLLRVPSISYTGEGIEETAGIVEHMLDNLGVKSAQFRAGRKSHPLVHGYLDAGAEKAAIVYGMYDVVPAGDPAEWNYPPFGARIANKKPYGDILVNRGVYNSKGALAGMLLAIKTMVDNQAMPLNLYFLIDGEEELGSRSLPRFVNKHKGTLTKADAVFYFNYWENADGVPSVVLGRKGCVFIDLVADGKCQGGPTREIHSSEAAWVKSPVWRLTQAVSTLVDENQIPVVDGLWDDVVEPSEDDLDLLRVLAKNFDTHSYKKEFGVEKFKFEGTNEELLKKYLFEPSLNICAIEAGNSMQGGARTVIPSRAVASIDIRLVPNMTIEGTRKKVMNHLRKRGFRDIKVRTYEDYPWTKVSPREDVSKACIEAMRYHGREPQVWPTVCSSAPFYLFDQVLGIPWGGAALGHGENAHGPNEFAVVRTMKDFEKSVVTVLWKYAEIVSEGRGRERAGAQRQIAR